MQEGKRQEKGEDGESSSPVSLPSPDDHGIQAANGELPGILDERLANLRDAIREIDEALLKRDDLSRKFHHQIGKEMKEIHYQLDHLNPPWKTGFHTEIEFFRLSLHKSLTSRRKDIRTEELKLWEHTINLLQERRKLLDEYKNLLSTKRRLS